MANFTDYISQGTPHVVVVLAGAPPFISAVNGHLTTTGMAEIEEQLATPDALETELVHGDGEYLFAVVHNSGQYDSYGRCEMPAHWELDLVEYRSQVQPSRNPGET